MNFKALSLAAAIGSFSLVTHSEQNYFVGIEAFTGTGEIEIEEEFSDGYTRTDTTDTDQTGKTLVLGMIHPTKVRTSLKYTSIDAEIENDFKFDMTGIDIDGTFGFAETNAVMPYVMAGLGYYTWKDSHKAFFHDDDDELKGIALNLGIGAAFKVHEGVEIDVSYKYKGIYWQGMETRGFYENSDIDVTTSTSNLTLGARFLF